MERRKYALGNNIRGYELGLISTVFVVAFTGAIILPFYVYLFGAGVFWEFVGIIICMAFVWNFESYRLMRYARRHKNILSLPSYFKYRFGDSKEYLRIVASSEIVILTMVIMSLMIKELGIILYAVFGLDTTFTTFLVCFSIALYLGLSGFDSIARTALFKAVFLLAVIIIISIFAFKTMGIHTLIQNMMAMDVTGSVSDYMNVLYHNGKLLVPEDYISLIFMGLLTSGIPFLLSVFFSANDSSKINVGKFVMIIYLFIFFAAAAIMGVISRGYLYPEKLTGSLSIYIARFFKCLSQNGNMGVALGYLYILMIVLAMVITFEGSLHVVVTIIYDDIIRAGRLVRIRKSREKLYIIVITFIISIICYVVGECLNFISINLIVTFIGALGCAVAPTVLMSLRWRRMNKFGCIAGLISGLAAVPFFKYAAFFGDSDVRLSLSDLLGVNSVALSMLVSFLMIILVSLITPKPSQEVLDEYDDIKHRIVN
ncbi:MAG: hypothetical protein J5517_09210 [Eubacterium sp.]|nr:hypothetical protein [Eubacterium sp.]